MQPVLTPGNPDVPWRSPMPDYCVVLVRNALDKGGVFILLSAHPRRSVKIKMLCKRVMHMRCQRNALV